MRIQYFNGGLANQVFQYIFYRYGQLATGSAEEWILDDSFFFFRYQHNGYELDKVFGLKPNLLSQRFSPDDWNIIITNRKNGFGTSDILKSMGLHVSMIAEASNYKADNPFSGKVYPIPCNEYHPEILKFKDDVVYYFGYWINSHWFNTYKDIFVNELTFPPILDSQNLSYATQIKSSLSVGIHIRRGDYLNLGLDIAAPVYFSAIQELLAEYPDAFLYIFSDDLNWCEMHADELGLSLTSNTTFIHGNVNGNNFIDLQLLSMCNGILLSKSAFCYLALLLNKNLSFYIDLPNWHTYKHITYI